MRKIFKGSILIAISALLGTYLYKAYKFRIAVEEEEAQDKVPKFLEDSGDVVNTSSDSITYMVDDIISDVTIDTNVRPVPWVYKFKNLGNVEYRTDDADYKVGDLAHLKVTFFPTSETYKLELIDVN